MTSKAFVRTTRPSFYALDLKHTHIHMHTREIAALAGRSSREELDRTGTLLVNPTTATPTVG